MWISTRIFGSYTLFSLLFVLLTHFPIATHFNNSGRPSNTVYPRRIDDSQHGIIPSENPSVPRGTNAWTARREPYPDERDASGLSPGPQIRQVAVRCTGRSRVPPAVAFPANESHLPQEPEAKTSPRLFTIRGSRQLENSHVEKTTDQGNKFYTFFYEMTWRWFRKNCFKSTSISL